MIVAVFEMPTGHIRWIIEGAQSLSNASRGLPSNWGVLEIVTAIDPNTHYMDLTWPEMPTLMPKQLIEPDVSTDGLVATLSNLPKPCAVIVDGSRYETPDGSMEIEFNLPGKYRIELAHPHYLTKTLEVTL